MGFRRYGDLLVSGTFWTIEQVEPIIKERNELRQRVAELECSVKAANLNLINLEREYVKRGERMKEMRVYVPTGKFCDWFDEKGEPL